MALTMVTVTGRFPNATGQDATVQFTPTADLDDPADAEFVAQVPVVLDLSATGTFSQALISTSNSQVQPAGWQWTCIVTINGRSAQFSFALPSTPSPVDISVLMPAGFQL